MSSKRNSSIYLLVGLLIIVGILIFVFKHSLLSYLSIQVFGDNEGKQEISLQASSDNVVDLDILENQQFKVLEDQVLYFDFNYVGKAVVNKDVASGVSVPSWTPVYLGNANPFFIPVEKTEIVEETIN